MKTPLTITAKVWNFCQLCCPYCVAGCNAAKWKPTRPPLPHELLDFRALVDWIQKFTPGAAVHVSGGEPLLWDGIENAVQMLIDAGIDTTITTNGLLIDKRARLLDMPLKWLVTYHRCSSFLKWRRNAALVRNRPHLACALAGHGMELTADCIKRFDGFNFAISKINGLRIIEWQPQPEDMRRIASDTIHLIEPDGRVFPCNNKKSGEIGNIGGMWYDKSLARTKDRECFQCVRGSHCQAYQSAVLTAFSLRAG